MFMHTTQYGSAAQIGDNEEEELEDAREQAKSNNKRWVKFIVRAGRGVS